MSKTVYAGTLSAAGVSSSAWPEPARLGYTFAGWYLDPDATESVFSDTTDLSGDGTVLSDGAAIPVTLYAGWTALPPPLTVTTVELPDAQVGMPYTATLAASGGTASYSWSVKSGSLPAHLILDPNTGAITGTPARAGTSSVTLSVTDSSTPAASVTQAYTITVTFTDVPAGSQFFDDIAWLADTGVTVGYTDGTFQPTTAISRQSMAAFLYRYAIPGSTPPACGTAPFPDVPATALFCPEITWLASTGITVGFQDGGFHPEDPVSRQSIAAILHRLDGLGS